MGCPILDLLLIGLTVGLFWVCDRGRAVLLGTAGFFTVGAGVFSGVIEGVTFPARRAAYGSAVAGLLSSGRRIGRRIVPDISEPVLVGPFRADFVDSPDIAEGGRAGPKDAVDTVDAVEMVLALAPRDFAEIDFTGE